MISQQVSYKPFSFDNDYHHFKKEISISHEKNPL